MLDLGLPDITGRDVLTQVRELRPETKVVIFSGADAEDRSWYEQRAAGYVLKDADIDYLVDLLESVTRPAASEEATLDLPQDLASVRVARSFVRDRLAEWDLESLLDDAFIVVQRAGRQRYHPCGLLLPDPAGADRGRRCGSRCATAAPAPRSRSR